MLAKIPITVVNVSDAPIVGWGMLLMIEGEFHPNVQDNAPFVLLGLFLACSILLINAPVPFHLVEPVKLLKAFRASAKALFHRPTT